MNITTFTKQMKQGEDPLFEALHRLKQVRLEQVKSSQKFAGWNPWNPAS
ncbi:MAG: hypothetical protein AAFQ98_21985 [Bacteroidota bacterium]